MNFDEIEEESIESLEPLLMALKGLVASEAWGAYNAVITKQQASRLDNIILHPLEGMDAVPGQEYAKGEIAGMRMALQLPQALIEAMSERLAILRQERREAEGEQ